MEKHFATTPTAGDRLLNFREALATLGISKSNAYRLLEQDALPRPIKIGRRTFFSERELQAWIANKLAGRGQEVSSG